MADPIIVTSGISGTDGITPVYDSNARWCWWEIDEIYVGGQGEKRYVPKVRDYVIDHTSYEVKRVASIDPVTLIPTLVSITPPNANNGFSQNDILFGVGPGTQADTYRVYLDKAVTPYVLAVDARLKVGGSGSSFAKIFKGSDVSSSGKIISRLYDQNGVLLTDNIPLELAAFDTTDNTSIKVVSVCYTNESLTDGELVTVVIYNDMGHVVSKRQLLVENTAFIRSVNSGKKYITHISLDTPFLSPNSDVLIEFPINIPTVGLDLKGIVHYSDGTQLKMPVDGTKFKIFGLEQYVGTITGQRVPLVLSYTLSTSETTYNAVSADGKHITKPYTLLSQSQNGAYIVKLVGFPVWVDGATGYKMQWYMYTLDRNFVYNVTEFVRFNINTAAFDPRAYGFLQNLSVSINLRDVSGSFRSYIHVQAVDIVLAVPGTSRTTNWTIGFDQGQTPPYGIDLYANAQNISAGVWKLKIDAGIASFDEWLERTYFATKPIVNQLTELIPPKTNYFAVICGTTRTEFPIENWNTVLTVGDGPVINGTLFIEFFFRNNTTDIRLATAGMPIYDASVV